MSVAHSPDRRYTYRDYKTWPDNERWELINGVAYAMTPAPSTSHQSVVLEMSIQVGTYLRGKACRTFVSPIDVFFTYDDGNPDDVSTIVQPDLLVVCDPKKIRPNGIVGTPDIIVEVLSPSTARHDQITKALLYEQFGVKEFWVVDPTQRLVTKRTLEENGKFKTVFLAVTG
jgi:Uma2 family endonuclease